jgi:hypothetical protein
MRKNFGIRYINSRCATLLQRYYKIIVPGIVFILLICLPGCANQASPSGGERDRTPPEILDLYPQSGTTNFHDDHFELSFSKFIDKRSLKDAIFISPSIGGDLELNWSWNAKAVKVKFPKPLKKNITYVVTIGTDLVDINEKNRMASSYTFSFSTGSVIDKGEVAGRVYTEKPSGVMIFAYKKDDTATMNPSKVKPDYISQVGDSGAFRLKGLGPGTYRIFAIEDQYRDLLFQADQDRYGSPYKEITLSVKDTLFKNLNYFLSKVDTVSPRILSTTMTDKHHILIGMSEELDSATVNPNSFFVYDSTSGEKSIPKYCFHGNSKSTDVVISLTKELKYENNNYLFAAGIKDIAGNTTKLDFSKLTPNPKEDTTKACISKMSPMPNSSVDNLYPVFRFSFNDAFDSTLARQGITFTDTSGKLVDYSLSFPDNASIKINVKQELQTKQEFKIKFDYNKFISLSGGKLDSVFIYRFKTINGLDFTGASGTMLNVDLKRNPIVVLEGAEKNKELVYVQKLNSDYKFNFERVEAGKYNLWCYYDEDNNGKYSYGQLFPFLPGEKFVYFKDIIELRPRWSVTDIFFDFGD